MMGKLTDAISIIDRGLSIDGLISSRGKLIIKGAVKGRIEGETLVIARGGKLHADVNVMRMTVGGSYVGELHAKEELVILKTGQCSGSISCKNLTIEAGGVLNGRIAGISGTTGPQDSMETSPAIPTKA